ncbi:MAG: glycosyltransferase [Chloroflexi bacterium]|nr:glycosyltransferase [Chloroflexota bacterium]
MRILQVSTSDIAGGAERVAWNLFGSYRARGHSSWLAVGNRHSSDRDVIEIPPTRPSMIGAGLLLKTEQRLAPWERRIRGVWRIRYWLQTFAGGIPAIEDELGWEDFAYPGSLRLLDLTPQRPDIVHLHNLHGYYFDLRFLPKLSQRVPVLATLHDAWLLSGHCAHSFDCERWVTGCGKCPYLKVYPALRRDGSAFNWRRKKSIYARSRLYVSTPSRWLMGKVERSILAPAIVESRVIPHGVEPSLFRPADRRQVRKALGISPTAPVLLFSANGIRQNIWKDYQTMRSAVAQVAETWDGPEILFIALGEDSPTERIGKAEIRFVPYQKDRQSVASYYQAADIYLHGARADTFPNAVIEALACGTPVVATRVGGVPEQIEDEVNGFLTSMGDSAAMAGRITQLLRDDGLRNRVGQQAAEGARRAYDLNRQTDQYLSWYDEILAQRRREHIPPG